MLLQAILQVLIVPCVFLQETDFVSRSISTQAHHPHTHLGWWVKVRGGNKRLNVCVEVLNVRTYSFLQSWRVRIDWTNNAVDDKMVSGAKKVGNTYHKVLSMLQLVNTMCHLTRLKAKLFIPVWMAKLKDGAKSLLSQTLLDYIPLISLQDLCVSTPWIVQIGTGHTNSFSSKALMVLYSYLFTQKVMEVVAWREEKEILS